jgi:hypothetical protein
MTDALRPRIPATHEVPSRCDRCQRVTPHYPADAPTGGVVWICDECALIEALVQAAAADLLVPDPSNR